MALQRSDFRFFHRLRVRWAEVDMQKIVFNPHSLMYFDCAIADYQAGGQRRAFGDTDFVGTGQPVGLDRDRQSGSRRQISIKRQPDQRRIRAFEHIVHQPGDDQRLWHRIAQRRKP